ncbi:MAG: dienelactone hydrolase, partial [Rhodospirillaceae bacterium]
MAACLIALSASASAEAALVNQNLRVEATIEGKPATLEAILIRPDGPGPFPLAVVTHGSPRDGKEREKMSPTALLPQATVFARRGWAVAIVMRRGYGGSSG